MKINKNVVFVKFDFLVVWNLLKNVGVLALCKGIKLSVGSTCLIVIGLDSFNFRLHNFEGILSFKFLSIILYLVPRVR